MDSSASITPENYQKQIQFIGDLATSVEISTKDVLVGLVIFSDNAKKMFDLKDYTTRPDLLQALLSIPHFKGLTATSKALNLVVDSLMFSTTNGARVGVNDTVIVMTDGMSQDGAATLAAAQRLKSSGVTVLAVGIGLASTAELQAIASSPDDVYLAPTFDTLQELHKKMSYRVCRGAGLSSVGCSTSLYGCCSDGFTSAAGPNKLGCAAATTSAPTTAKPTTQTTTTIKTITMSPTTVKPMTSVPTTTTPTTVKPFGNCVGAPCQQICQNTNTGYACSCRAGYIISSTDPTKCVDINECAVAFNRPCQQVCTNTLGSYTCSCTSGYVVSSTDPSKCVVGTVRNDCSSSPCQQTCTNTNTGYSCSCMPGYAVSATDPTKCQDINECNNPTNPPCEQICSNTIGSYTCSCRSGYTISATDPTKCVDINECANTASPPCEQNCVNTPGSFTCSCRSGFTTSTTDPTKCVDINECLRSPCPQICTNTIGSYSCSCRSGYVYSNGACVDVNECASTVNRPCEQICVNTAGGYSCSCTAGYVVSATDPTKCVGDCSTSPCQQTCTNTATGYTCSCRTGFAVSATNSSACQDINECNSTLGSPCEQTCTNTFGKFVCTCRSGFSVSVSDPTRCTDINECLTSPCPHICTNTIGSYSCSCRSGYVYSNGACVDVNECASSKSPCEHNCTNTVGSFICSCAHGYVVSLTETTQCDIIVPCITLADIVFVLDSSSSIGKSNYQLQLDFTSRLVSQFNVSEDATQFGALIFGTSVQELFDLNTFSDQQSIQQAILAAPYMGSQTWTNLALEHVITDGMFSTTSCDRPQAVKTVVLLTNGISNDPKKTEQAAQALKDQGINIIAVGIGSGASSTELNKIASSPSDVYMAESFESLSQIQLKLAQSLC
ncbi:matrilin-2-like isoform X2 [Physella acuta]|uniref:matrilin-2-like isoform X2 n=1 Tax=Physella acuta TaxID=109671 RepID=UPI0027DBAE59|nr:matrilin-2-like isoform X2 [Physella acuta]